MSTEKESIYREIGIRKSVLDFGNQIEAGLKERFRAIDETAEYNQLKVIRAMQENRVSEACFQYASGYGYDDLGRDTLEKVYASVFHTEDAWYGLRLPAGPTLCPWLSPQTYARETSFCLQLESHMIPWKRSSVSAFQRITCGVRHHLFPGRSSA